MQKKIILIIILILFFNQLKGEDILTLDEAISTGLINNYSVKISRNHLTMSENSFSYGNAGFFPLVELTGTQTYSVSNSLQEYVSGDILEREGARASNLNAGIGFNWVLFNGFRISNQYKMLREQNMVSQYELSYTIENTIADIIIAYYDIVRLQQHIRTTESAIEILDDRLRLAEERFNIGSASRLEVSQSKADINNEKSELLRLNQQLTEAKMHLNTIMGRLHDVNYNVTDTIIVDKVLEFNELNENFLKNNPELNIQRKRQILSNINLNLEKSHRYPEIGFIAGYNYTDSRSEAGFIISNQTTGMQYGLTARFTIFDGFRTNTAVQNAKIEYENQELELEFLNRQLSSHLASQFLAYRSNIETAELEAENLQLVRENVEIAMEQYRQGLITGLELREAQRMLLNVESRLTNSLFAAKANETKLLSMGGMLVGRSD